MVYSKKCFKRRFQWLQDQQQEDQQQKDLQQQQKANLLAKAQVIVKAWHAQKQVALVLSPAGAKAALNLPAVKQQQAAADLSIAKPQAV